MTLERNDIKALSYKPLHNFMFSQSIKIEEAREKERGLKNIY